MEGFNPKLNVLLIEDHELCNLILGPTYFKSINPICIDNFLIDWKARFMKNLALETGISDHHKLIGPKLRSTFTKEKPSKILYCC